MSNFPLCFAMLQGRLSIFLKCLNDFPEFKGDLVEREIGSLNVNLAVNEIIYIYSYDNDTYVSPSIGSRAWRYSRVRDYKCSAMQLIIYPTL